MAQTKKMFERIIENAMYLCPKTPMYHGTWFEGDYQICSDGNRAIVIYNPVDVKARKEEYFTKVTPLFTDAEKNCKEEIQLPDIKDIKTAINKLIGRRYKSERVLYRLGDNSDLAVVNALYLYECMAALDATTIKYDTQRPKKGMLLMETDIGKAILLPVRNETDRVGYWKGEV